MEYSQPALLKERLRVIKDMIYSDSLTIPVWKTRKAKYTVPVEYVDYSEWTEMSLGTVWACHYDDARWFEASITVPENFAHKHLVLELNLGGEGVVSVNGEPLGSLAFYHCPDYILTQPTIRHRTRIELGDREAGEVLNISVQLNLNYKDHFKGTRLVKYDGNVSTTYTMKTAALCVVDDDTEAYYHDALHVIEALDLLSSPAAPILDRVHTAVIGLAFENMLRTLTRDNALVIRMREALMKSMLVIPFYESEAAMRANMAEASRILKEELAKLPATDRGNVYLSGLAHLDLVWLWQEKHSVRKIANTTLNTLALIDRYPEHIFTFSQPYAFYWLEKYYPDIFEKVKEKVASGNIDPVGNLWVEIDCNLAGGESIIRQLLYGRMYLLEKFGKCSDIFLMPDSFGYNAALPQIMAKSGIKYFLSAKLNSNETYRFPYTLFQWQGLDGTRIPTYLMRNAYNGVVTSEALDATYHRQDCKAQVDTSYLTFGYGDGGGGPDYVMLEAARRLADMPGIPKAKIATLDEFFEKVTEHQDEFPVWNDELYFDRHRGTYTTQAKIKKNNRMAELALRRTEMAASLREITLGIPYPTEKIEWLWKKVMHLQFHDSLPGSSITPVYEDCDQEYAEFFKVQGELMKEMLGDLTAAVPHENGQQVAWNFLPWERNAVVGDKLMSVPSMGWSAASCQTSDLSVSANHMENRFFSMKLDDKGRIISLIHKQTGRETIKAPSNILQLFEDPTKDHLSAWDIYPEYTNKEENLECDSVEVVECTATRGVIRLTWHFHRSSVTQDVTIYSDIPRIDFITHANWQEDMHLLKAAFYPKVRSSRATYEVQFGAVERPTHRNTEYDAIRFEGCGQKWADLSQNDFGLSILNDCKYGYDILNDRMRITLLRAPLEPDYKADRGEHDFIYSLYPHADTWENGGTVRAGFELNEPVQVAAAEAKADAVPASFVNVDHASVILDTFKKAEDGNGYILRFYESCGKGGNVTVSFARDLRAVSICDMMEEGREEVAFDGNSFTFETSPYCIHTYRIEL